MSFVRVNPGNCAIGDPLTSAQQNQLDVDHANALDKSTAGDTISGTVTFAGAGKIFTSGPGQVVSNDSSGIVSQVTGGIQVGAAGGLQSTVDGGIRLDGSANDWIAYGSARTYEVHENCFFANSGIGTLFTFAASADIMSGLAFSVDVGYSPLHRVYNGSTLTRATLYFAIGASHSNVPAQPIKFGIFARSPSGNVGIAPSNKLPLLSTGGGFVSFTAGSGAGWYAGGVVQSLDFTPDQNNVGLDTVGLRYFVGLADESGVGSFAGNLFFGVRLTYTNITTSQPG